MGQMEHMLYGRCSANMWLKKLPRSQSTHIVRVSTFILVNELYLAISRNCTSGEKRVQIQNWIQNTISTTTIMYIGTLFCHIKHTIFGLVTKLCEAECILEIVRCVLQSYKINSWATLHRDAHHHAVICNNVCLSS